MKYFALLCCSLFLFSSCHYFGQKITGEKIAEVNGKVLLQSDIKGILPTGLSPEDSLLLLKSYVNNWARKQLIAQMAEQYLTKEQKDVSQELEDYRLSLLIFRYEKLYLEQRLDTIVNDREIAALYNASPQNFLLTRPIAHALLIKVSEDIPKAKRVRELYRSAKPADREELSQICSAIAEKYTNFDDKWVDAEFLATELPLDSKQIENEWANGHLNVNADGYEYFVHLYDMAASGDQAPMEYERGTISSIIQNKRRQQLLKSLENSIFNDALNHNHLKIYIDN